MGVKNNKGWPIITVGPLAVDWRDGLPGLTEVRPRHPFNFPIRCAQPSHQHCAQFSNRQTESERSPEKKRRPLHHAVAPRLLTTPAAQVVTSSDTCPSLGSDR